MQERFKQLLKEKNLTAARFAELIQVNASAMSHILNGRNKPGFDVLEKIVQAFPDVNLNWLISGQGNIYNSVPQNTNLSEKDKQENMPSIPPSLQPLQGNNPSSVLSLENVPKKIKRIILFFDNGTFEIYENGMPVQSSE